MGRVEQWLACLLPDPASPGSLPSVDEIFSKGTIVDVAEVNQHHSLEESRQWLENADGTNLALTSGKILLQKYP